MPDPLAERRASPLTEAIGELLDGAIQPPATITRPPSGFPGAVCGVDDGRQVHLVSRGAAYRYADGDGAELPAGQQVVATDDTVFDLASLTKLFTATVVVRLAELGRLELDDPVAHHLDEYAGPAPRSLVTVRQLLTHTSGLPAEIHVWRDSPDPDSRRAAVLSHPLEAPPATRSRYSCVGYITLGLLAERLTGRPLDELVAEYVCVPLGLDRTRYRPLSGVPPQERAAVKDTIAATEMRPISWSSSHDPADPDPRGIVHDENAASLDGVSGNAGLFAPASDLLTFGRAVLGAATTDRANPLGMAREWARSMLTPQLPVGIDPGYQSGLGFRVDDPSFMGALAGTGQAYGHTGFTGTSLVIDEARDLVLVLMTNRVHPSRSWSDLNPFRRRLAQLVADHCPVGGSARSQAAWP